MKIERDHGYIEFSQSDWVNKIPGKDYHKPLSMLGNKKIVHIGFHRTGTTLLQRTIFPRFDLYADIFSNESITGALFNSGMGNIDKIYEIVPGARIIIVIRNQMGIINSSFRNYIRKGGTYAFDDYALNIIAHHRYDYAKLVSGYFDRFGKGNCAVFLYEDLKCNPREFINSMLEFAGINSISEFPIKTVNKGPTKYYNEYARWINLLDKIMSTAAQHRHQRNMNGLPKTTHSFTIKEPLLYFGRMIDEKIIRNFLNENNTGEQIRCKKVRKAIQSAYSESNRQLERILNRNLTQYGYL